MSLQRVLTAAGMSWSCSEVRARNTEVVFGDSGFVEAIDGQ